MTKDEEANIETCLRALTDFDEVFVVDSDSTDRTVALAESLGATVVPFTWNGAYPKKKQWCLESLPFRNAWAMYVDGDEIVTPELVDEIGRLLPSATESGFFVAYDYVFLDKVLRHGRLVKKLVLLKHERAAFAQLDDLETERAGEVELHYQPTVDGTIGTLANRMIHDDHDTLYHYFERHNRYSDWEAVVRDNDSLFSSDEATVGVRALAKRFFARLPAKGLVAFLYSFIVRAGFRDGRAGFHYALSLGFYYWQIAVKQQERASRRSSASGTSRRPDEQAEYSGR